MTYYNRIIETVDKFDHFRERYAIGQRSIKCWHRVLNYLVDMAIANGYLFMKTSNRRFMNQLIFTINLEAEKPEANRYDF